MSVDDGFVLVFFAVLALVIGTFVYRMVRHDGFRAALFGAPIERTVGEVAGSGVKLMNMGLEIHRLDGGRDRAVGVELVARYHMMPIALSAAEARKLIAFLEDAAAGREGA